MNHRARRRRRRRLRIIAMCALAAVVCAAARVYVWKHEHRPAVLEAQVIALKTGQALFIRTPEDRRILVNGGPNSEIIRHLTRILPFYSRRIDTVIVTADQARVATGLVDILDRYDVGELIVPAVTLTSLGLASTTDPAYQALLETAERRSIAIRAVSRGDTMPFGVDVTAETLFPASPVEFSYSKASPPEIVLRVAHGDASFISIGGISTKAQRYLTGADAAGSVLRSQVLIAAGNLSSNGLDEFIRTVRPSFVVHSQSPQKPGRAQSSLRKKPLNALVGMNVEDIHNLKKSGSISLFLDGAQVWIK